MSIKCKILLKECFIDLLDLLKRRRNFTCIVLIIPLIEILLRLSESEIRTLVIFYSGNNHRQFFEYFKLKFTPDNEQKKESTRQRFSIIETNFIN